MRREKREERDNKPVICCSRESDTFYWVTYLKDVLAMLTSTTYDFMFRLCLPTLVPL